MVAPGPDSHRITRLGDYAIVRVLGEGGMGIVYEAVERLSQRRVALKVMHSNIARLPGARERFFNEMRISATLDHPNIVRCLACTEIDGRLVMVLEYLEGCTLRDELTRSGALPVERVLRVANAVCAALVEAHGARDPIVHRDLKPENIMLLSNGGVRVMDFGVAKVMTREGKSTTTDTIGTVLYMSPEQAEGRFISPSTDLYALGVVLYEMLTGKVPFDGPSVMVTLRMHCEAPPPPFPPEIRRAVPPTLESLVMWLLEKTPERRAPSAQAVIEKLREISMPGAVSASRAGTPVPQQQRLTPSVVLPSRENVRQLDTFQLVEGRAQPRRTLWIATAALAVLGASAFAAWLVLFQLLPSPTPKRKVRSSPTIQATEPAAEVAPPPRVPKIVEEPSCGSDACAPFTPPDPASVQIETVVAEATRLAQSIDPNSKLSDVVALGLRVTNGRVDLTQGNPALDLLFTKGVKAVELLALDAEKGRWQLLLQKNKEDFSTRDPMPPISCTLVQAWNAAIAKGFQPGTHGSVDAISKKWRLSDRALESEAEVDFKTCAVSDITPPKNHRE